MENQNIQLPNTSKEAYERFDKFIMDPDFVEFAIRSKNTSLITLINDCKKRTTQKKQVLFDTCCSCMDDGTRQSILYGDILSTTELQKKRWMQEFKRNSILVIVTNYGRILLKEILNYIEETNEITCHSWNSSPEYQDFNLRINDIEEIYYIETISRNLEINPRVRT